MSVTPGTREDGSANSYDGGTRFGILGDDSVTNMTRVQARFLKSRSEGLGGVECREGAGVVRMLTCREIQSSKKEQNESCSSPHGCDGRGCR